MSLFPASFSASDFSGAEQDFFTNSSPYDSSQFPEYIHHDYSGPHGSSQEDQETKFRGKTPDVKIPFSCQLLEVEVLVVDPVEGFDEIWSRSEGRKIEKVPILRVFGSTTNGQTACIHIHNAYPYFFINIPDNVLQEYDSIEKLASYTSQLSLSLNRAMDFSTGNKKIGQYVHMISIVRGKPFYGYSFDDEIFFKVFVYNPMIIPRMATLLRTKSVMEMSFKVFESHVPFPLQFLLDYNIHGMEYVNFDQVWFRGPLPSERRRKIWKSEKFAISNQNDDSTLHSSSQGALYHGLFLNDSVHPSCISNVKRESKCEIEVDTDVSNIVFSSSSNVNQNPLAEQLMVPSLAYMWEDERKRRIMKAKDDYMKEMALKGKNDDFQQNFDQFLNHQSLDLGSTFDSSIERNVDAPIEFHKSLLNRFDDLVRIDKKNFENKTKHLNSPQTLQSSLKPSSNSASLFQFTSCANAGYKQLLVESQTFQNLQTEIRSTQTQHPQYDEQMIKDSQSSDGSMGELVDWLYEEREMETNADSLKTDLLQEEQFGELQDDIQDILESQKEFVQFIQQDQSLDQRENDHQTCIDDSAVEIDDLITTSKKRVNFVAEAQILHFDYYSLTAHSIETKSIPDIDQEDKKSPYLSKSAKKRQLATNHEQDSTNHQEMMPSPPKRKFVTDISIDAGVPHRLEEEEDVWMIPETQQTGNQEITLPSPISFQKSPSNVNIDSQSIDVSPSPIIVDSQSVDSSPSSSSNEAISSKEIRDAIKTNQKIDFQTLQSSFSTESFTAKMMKARMLSQSIAAIKHEQTKQANQTNQTNQELINTIPIINQTESNSPNTVIDQSHTTASLASDQPEEAVLSCSESPALMFAVGDKFSPQNHSTPQSNNASKSTPPTSNDLMICSGSAANQDSHSQQEIGPRRIVLKYAQEAPSWKQIINGMISRSQPVMRYQAPFYSNPNDVPKSGFEFGGVKLKMRTETIEELPNFTNRQPTRSSPKEISHKHSNTDSSSTKYHLFGSETQNFKWKPKKSNQKLRLLTPAIPPPRILPIEHTISHTNTPITEEKNVENENDDDDNFELISASPKLSETMRISVRDRSKQPKKSILKIQSSETNDTAQKLLENDEKRRESKSALFASNAATSSQFAYSQVDAPTPSHSSGFALRPEARRPFYGSGGREGLKIISLEVFATSNGNLTPDPSFCPVEAIYFTIRDDFELRRVGMSNYRDFIGLMRINRSKKFQTQKENSNNQDQQDQNKNASRSNNHDIKSNFEETNHNFGSQAFQTSSSSFIDQYLIDRLFIQEFEDEIQLLNAFRDFFVFEVDPDIVLGYECQQASLGYILERSLILKLKDYIPSFGRTETRNGNQYDNASDSWSYQRQSGISMTGRVVLNVWRIMRSELALQSYSFENVAYHVLHKRFFHLSHIDLTKNYTGLSKLPKSKKSKNQQQNPIKTQEKNQSEKNQFERNQSEKTIPIDLDTSSISIEPQNPDLVDVLQSALPNDSSSNKRDQESFNAHLNNYLTCDDCSWVFPNQRWSTDLYYLERSQSNLFLLDTLNVVSRTSEFARMYGITFYSVLSRGSQYRVESLMLRMTKAKNYVCISPTKQQVGQQLAPESIPLVLEPQSQFYTDPVLVLDFQSLYPSIIIAYNYCFSTCLGKLPSKRDLKNCLSKMENLGETMQSKPSMQSGPVDDPVIHQIENLYSKRLGVLNYEIPIGGISSLNEMLYCSPNGVMFVKPELHTGILPRMLHEILETRVMVKESMKRAKKDPLLWSLLDSRQLGLKMIANVTYGYASASFSGRMPCIDLADSIIQTSRETLEKAIKMVNEHPSWNAKVIYGDTDSMFVLLKGATRQRAFEVGNQIAKTVTDANPWPVKLKFEKCYHPCVLLAKKRYCGYMYESEDQLHPTFDAKGIETVRRDTCPAVSKILEKSLRILFETKDLTLIKSYLQKQWTKILQGRISFKDFIFRKEVRLGTYRGPHAPPAALVATKQIKIDPRATPRYGERVPYIVVNGDSPKSRLIDLVQNPAKFAANFHSTNINANYYITRNIIPALSRVFNLFGVSILDWYQQMPKKFRLAKKPYARNLISNMSRREQSEDIEDMFEDLDHDDEAEEVFGSKKNKKRSKSNYPGLKSTIDQYYSSQYCPICDALTSDPICEKCANSKASTTFILSTRIKQAQRKRSNIHEICMQCSSYDRQAVCGNQAMKSRQQTNQEQQQQVALKTNSAIKCDSLDCTVYYERIKYDHHALMMEAYQHILDAWQQDE